MLLVGTIIGVLLNVMFPDILILILSDIVIVYATWRTARKGVRIWKKETANKREAEQIEAQKEQHDLEMQRSPDSKTAMNSMSGSSTTSGSEGGGVPNGSGRVDSGLSGDGADNGTNGATTATSTPPPKGSTHEHIPTASNQQDIEALSDGALSSGGTKSTSTLSKDAVRRKLSEGCGVTEQEMTDDNIAYAQAFIAKESELWRPIGIICIVWLAVVSFAILKKEEITSVTLCSGLYWLFTFLPIPIMAGVSYYMTKQEYDFYNLKVEKKCWVPAEGDIKLDGSFVRILKYPAIASIAGVLAGLLGIGGGMVVSPLFIELGVLPMVAAATSAMAVMITSSAAMLQFLLLGYLQLDYSLAFMTVGMLGGFFGQTGVGVAVKRWGRTSIVVFAVAIIMALAVILMTINGLTELVDGVSFKFYSPCDE